MCCSGCRSNPQTRGQFRANDHLYFSFQPALRTAHSRVFPTDRTRFTNDLLGCFLADNAESMFGTGRTDVIGIAHQKSPPTPPLSPMAYPHSRPLFLPLGLLVDDSYRHYLKEHFPRGDERIISVVHRIFGISVMSVPICHRALYRQIFWYFHRIGASLRTEKHCLCYLDSHHLPAPTFYRRSWLLYSLAEYHQFY